MTYSVEVQGASFGQAVLSTAVSAGAGYLAGTAVSGLQGAWGIVGGAVAGGVSACMTQVVLTGQFDGSLGYTFLNGAAWGALSGAIAYAKQGAPQVTQASAEEQQGGGLRARDSVESVLAGAGYGGGGPSNDDIMSLLDAPTTEYICSVGSGCPTLRGAAEGALQEYNPLSIAANREATGLLYYDPIEDQYYSTSGHWGTSHGSNPLEALGEARSGAYGGAEIVGDWHTHGGYDPGFYSERFGQTDVAGSLNTLPKYGIVEQAAYLGTPSGAMLEWKINWGVDSVGGFRNIQTSILGYTSGGDPRSIY
jgi:hypothetical protein